MVTDKLYGGLGNQMFQYALGRSVAARYHASLALDLSHYDQFAHLGRKYELGSFKLRQDVVVGGPPRRYYDSSSQSSSLGMKQTAKRILGAPMRITEHGFSYDLIGLI